MSKIFVQIGDEIREMNDIEKAQYKIDLRIIEQLEIAAAAKEAARAAALAKLGLTADEIAALFG